ncbi:MAG: phnA protein [Proteobacteria bacterium]|nr:phnA protein [Pseudomonadota bacterium]MBU1140424.1 phnA protein [Pseudomonadota bacterium]MBU1234010.1 phnA protein [Pseudomonadota bacterium]MBU1419773.1 phnA protein [Pseudomonadota bacterium]MBU1456345.1 phnA protein [Pseudomonadota bacterium]
MSQGHEKHQQRLEQLSFLGKTLVRRSGAKCELCSHAHGTLYSIEIPPVPELPSEDHTLFLCESCKDVVETSKLNPQEMHYLEEVIWSDLPVLQVTAVRLCRRLRDKGEAWAAELLDTVYLSPEVEEWLSS